MDPNTVFEPHIEPKDSPIGPQKIKTSPKLIQNQMSELKETKKMKIIAQFELTPTLKKAYFSPQKDKKKNCP